MLQASEGLIRGMNKSAGLKLTVDTHLMRVLLAVSVAPSYLYYSLVVARNHFSVLTALCAVLLIVSQHLPNGSWNEFLTPVAGCLLNAAAICTTGFQRSPFLFVVLIPLLTYSTERDAVWVRRSVMLNMVTMTLLVVRSIAQADWFATLDILGLVGISQVASHHIRQVKKKLAFVVASAEIDQLTGLYNRRAFLAQFKIMLAEARGGRCTPAVAFLDIDRMKEINDTWGHKGGDEALKQAASAIKKSVRPSDMVARYGGDEFVVLFPNHELSAQSLRARLKEHLQALDFDGVVVPLNLSVGMAYFPVDGANLEELIAKADARMYEDKEAKKQYAISTSGVNSVAQA